MSRRSIFVRAAAVSVAAIATLAGGIGGAAAATASPSGHIAQVQPGTAGLTIVFTASNLPSGTTIDPSSVTVTLGGQKVSAVAKAANGTTQVQRTSVIVLDTSGSMAGAKLTSAKSAAIDYLNSVPADVRVGLVTFSNTAQVAVAPTRDRAAVSRVIGGLVAAGNTRLYDAVMLAVRTAGTTGTRNLLLLTDGKDDASTASLGTAVSEVRASGDTLDAVSIGAAPAQLVPLQALATAGRGGLVAVTDVTTLGAVFTSAAAEVTNQILVVAAVPEGLAGQSGTVAVAARAGSTAITDSVFSSYGAASGTPVVSASAVAGPKALTVHSSTWITTLLPWALGLLFIGLLVILAVAFVSASESDPQSSRVRRRLSVYTLAGKAPVKESDTTTVLGDSGVARSAVELAGRVVSQRDFDTAIGAKLESAGLPLRSAEWLLIHVGITIAGGLIFLLISGGRPLPAIIGLILGFVGPYVFLSVKESRRHSAFLEQMPNALQLMAGGLSAGYSLPQAVDSVMKECEAPTSTELSRAMIETRLGVDLTDALDGVADRMHSKDFSWVVMAIRIQRDVGGNLAEVLTTLAETLRERERLRRQVEVLSAEGRLSAAILLGLPIVFTIYLILVRPDYLSVLVHTFVGWLMIVTGVVLLIVGGFWLSKVVKVEV
jgi:tight adherence protein B